MTTAWAHLPNAALIDWVLQDVAAHPERWTAAWTAARGAARDAARGAARGAAQAAARDVAWDAARDAVAALVAWDVAWAVVWDAVAALVAWDDCQEVLDLPMDAFKFLVEVQDPRAVLLYSLKHVKEMS